MEKINITIGNNIYPYYLYENIKDLAIAMEKETRKHSNSILIYDSNIPRSCIDKLLIKCTTNSRISVVEYRISEDLKNMLTVNNVLDLFIKYKADRKTGIFVIGGGVLGNIVGLACGLLYRGISLIHIPSTLIACADSVLSLKQGIKTGTPVRVLYLAVDVASSVLILFHIFLKEKDATDYSPLFLLFHLNNSS